MTARLMTEGTNQRSSVDIAEESDFIAARINDSREEGDDKRH